MPVTVNKLENEPILIATLSGHVTVEDTLEVYRLSSELMGDAEHIFYRITDVRTAESDFKQMLGVIREATKGQPGSSTDPRIRTTFVGTTTWITFMRNALQNPKFGSKNMAAFHNMEDALKSIRFQIRVENEHKHNAS